MRIYNKTGCNLVEVFDHLVQTAYEKTSDRKYVEAVTAEIRITSMFLSALPFLLMLALRFLAPEMAKQLFSTLAGNLVIIFCVGMVFIGNRMISKMVAKALGTM